MSKRARSHVSMRDKLAAALGHMMHEVDGIKQVQFVDILDEEVKGQRGRPH